MKCLVRAAYFPTRLLGLDRSSVRGDDRVFNMGIGLILVVPASAAQAVVARAQRRWAIRLCQIGTIVSSTGDVPLVEYVD